MEAVTLSNTQKNRTTVDIYGQAYVIMGSESPSHIRHVASLVDNKMREISSKNPNLDASKLAVLTAVNAVNDYLKIKDQLDTASIRTTKRKGLKNMLDLAIIIFLIIGFFVGLKRGFILSLFI